MLFSPILLRKTSVLLIPDLINTHILWENIMRAALKEHQDIYKAVHRAQHVQRNWNLEATMPENDVEIILEAAQQATSKQNRAFYKVHAVQNREIIEQIHHWTRGFGTNDGRITTNPQTLAHLVLVFEKYDDPKHLPKVRHNHKWMKQELNDENYRAQLLRDQHMAVGVAAGAINITAAMMGYGTGCCACFDYDNIQSILGLDDQALLIMGIGIPGNKNRRVHHLDDSITFPTFKKEPIEVVTH